MGETKIQTRRYVIHTLTYIDKRIQFDILVRNRNTKIDFGTLLAVFLKYLFKNALKNHKNKVKVN